MIKEGTRIVQCPKCGLWKATHSNTIALCFKCNHKINVKKAQRRLVNTPQEAVNEVASLNSKEKGYLKFRRYISKK